jgi:hypothetical protein
MEKIIIIIITVICIVLATFATTYGLVNLLKDEEIEKLTEQYEEKYEQQDAIYWKSYDSYERKKYINWNVEFNCQWNNSWK